jgi:hypothetical protein
MSGPGFAMAARRAGAKYYVTNRPCPRGHYPLRYSANRTCAECNDARADARHLAKRGAMSRRHDNLTFNHHAEVAALPPDEADAKGYQLFVTLGDTQRGSPAIFGFDFTT